MVALVTVISTIIVLSVLIIFHEFGHFIVAKRSGIKVEIFSLGLGPRIIGVTKGETDYRLSLIPFGGYVKMAGDEPKDIKGEPNEFAAKSHLIRAGVIIAGPVFNLILAWLFFIIVSFMQGENELPTTVLEGVGTQAQLKAGDKIISVDGFETKTWDEIILQIDDKDSVNCIVLREGEKQSVMIYGKNPDLPDGKAGITPLVLPVVGRVIKNGVAWNAGIRENDLIKKIELFSDKKADSGVSIEISGWDTLVSIIRDNFGKKIGITWTRNNSVMSANLIPEKTQIVDEKDKVKNIGIIGIQLKTIKKPVGIIKGFKNGTLRLGEVTVITLKFFKNLFVGKLSPKLLGGPLAIGKFAGESVRWGIDSFMLLIAFLSIQLFLINLIPFPPLDGGMILIIGIEKLQKRPISERTIAIIQNIGFGLLMLLMVYVTFNDITRLVNK